MLQIVHIKNDGPNKPVRERRVSEKELLRREVLVIKAKDRIVNQEKAKKMFAAKIENIKRLKRELGMM